MENLQKKFDVIVVGAGTGGTTAARFAAQKGLNVCLIDRKARNQIGEKICGDAVGSDVFDFLKINHPKNEELSCHIKGAKLYTPNLKKCLTLEDPRQVGYVINRLEFGQRLLNEALDSGVQQFIDNAMALDLIYKDKSVSGVIIRLKNGEKVDLQAKITIDASGFNSPLRKRVSDSLVEKSVAKEDSILCYREIIKFSPQDLKVKDPDYITIILDQEKAPGGYIWYFPKNESCLNIGLGTFMDSKGKVKDYYQSFVFNEFIKTKNYNVLSSGGGVAPVRRPLWSCADNGIMFVGDTACHVNPLHGGGIDPSMRAGFYAANTAEKAISSGDCSLKRLWDYNNKILTDFGAQFAALDLLRIVLQKLTNKSLNFGLEKDLLTGTEILEIASKGNLNLSLIDMTIKAFKGFANPKLLLDLNYLRIKMNEILLHYKKFPKNINNIQEFNAWKENTEQIYNKIKSATFG